MMEIRGIEGAHPSGAPYEAGLGGYLGPDKNGVPHIENGDPRIKEDSIFGIFGADIVTDPNKRPAWDKILGDAGIALDTDEVLYGESLTQEEAASLESYITGTGETRKSAANVLRKLVDQHIY